MKMKSIKSTIFLSATLLGLGAFTGCGEGSSSGETITYSEGSNEETATINPNNDVVLQKGWYVKLTIQSDELKDDSTVFGYLEGASDSKDRYDSEALSSSGLYTTIYHEEFGSTKNYRSDYRAYKVVGEKSDTWVIKVNSGDADADVTLSWNGITYVTKSLKGGFDEEIKIDSPELAQMRLIDLETGDVISATDDDMQITFNMNGSNERIFHWLLLKEGESEPEIQPSVKMPLPLAKGMSIQTSEVEASDDFTPPAFEKH